MLLVDFIRDVAGLMGTSTGCDTSACGACTVLLDGRSAKSCTVLAVQANDREMTTIEGLGADHPLKHAFHDDHALQCGYCTPGMVMAAASLLAENPSVRTKARFAGASRATCAAAPATTTSSGPSSMPPR